jgi:hypothetical protein
MSKPKSASVKNSSNIAVQITADEVVSAAAEIAVYDSSVFFEKALRYGVDHGLLSREKLAEICEQAPRGMVQIARHFGTEFLRPEIETARLRMVNLVSIFLESSCNGDLRLAAESLRDNSFLSRSKGGSDMLKAMLAMPDHIGFDVDLQGGQGLAEWSLKSLADYRVELALRTTAQQKIQAAVWLAEQLGTDADDLAGRDNPELKDADAVMRTALLMQASGQTEMPDWPAFEKIILALRKKYASNSAAKVARKPLADALQVPAKLPAHLQPVLAALIPSVLADLPRILDSSLPVRGLFSYLEDGQTPAFLGRYFWLEDAMSEIADFEKSVSKAWDKATGGDQDEAALLTLFLCIAAGSAGKTVLTEKAAAALVRKIQKSGLKPALAEQYITAHAPPQYQDDYLRLWSAFVDEAQHTLKSDAVFALEDSLALLRRECRIK